MNRMMQANTRDFTGCRVLILSGRYKGREGVCTGKSADAKRWAISPEGGDEILQLVFEKEFGLLVDLSADPGSN
jgi:hypothetical protein